MKTVNHPLRSRDKLLHIETDGCIINIRVGLTNAEGRSVTSVEILSDEDWVLDGKCNTRLIQKPEVPEMDVPRRSYRGA